MRDALHTWCKHASPFPATRRSPTERHRSDQKRPKETQITSVWYTQFKGNDISHLVVDVAKCLHSANELCDHCSSALAGATWRWCQPANSFSYTCCNMSKLRHKQIIKITCWEFTMTRINSWFYPKVACAPRRLKQRSSIFDPEKTGHDRRTWVIAGPAS